MRIAQPAISRRVLLKGLSASVALPWLESISAFGRETASSEKSRTPQRFACLFIGDGISPPTGGRRATAPTMELGASLEPLAPFKEKLNVINGLFNREGDGGHARCTGNILSGVALQRGRIIKGGVSMDQLLAKHFEEETLAAEPRAGLRAAGERLPREPVLDGVRLAHLLAERRLADPDRAVPVAGLRQPVRRQDRQAAREHPRRRAASRPTTCAGKVSGTDQAEARRVPVVRPRDGAARAAAEHSWRRTTRRRRAERSQRPPAGQPKDFREYARLMCDIIALAFQTDRTRIATLLMSRDLSGQVYPFLGIRDDHHSYSHSNTGKEYQAIVKCHVEQYAYLLDRLAKMQEGERHGAGQLVHHVRVRALERAQRQPGAAGPRRRAGRHARRRAARSTTCNAGNDKRKLCSLYLSLMDRMGLELPEFGDSKERLAGI